MANRVLLRTVVVTMALVASLLSPVASSYASPGKVDVSISRGDRVPAGWTGPIEFDFSRAAHETYRLSLRCPKRARTVDFRSTSTRTHYSMTTNALLPGTCQLSIKAPGYRERLMRFYVDPPPLAAPTVSRNRSVFYPLVRDYYLDTVTFTYLLNRRADVSLVVLNSAGKSVRRYNGKQPKGRHTWEWDGYSDWDNLAPEGEYRLRVSATAGGTTRTTTSAPVAIRRGYLIHHNVGHKYGDQGWPNTKGSCYIARYVYTGEADLDCWGGRYAQMSYTFEVPSSAHNFKFGVAGYFTAADFCCRGQLSKVGVRVSPTRYRVIVKVNGWRAYAVERVSITYDTRRAVRVTG